MKVTVTSLNSKLFSHAGKWWAAPETDEWKVQYEQTPRHPSLCRHLPPPWLPLSSRGGGWVAQREGLQQTVSDRRPDKPRFVYKQGMLALHGWTQRLHQSVLWSPLCFVSLRTVSCLGVLTGAQLFSLNKEELKAVIPEEGARVYSQLAVQKSLLEVSEKRTAISFKGKSYQSLQY